MSWNPSALIAALKGDTKNAIAASTQGGIEAQEAEGQQDFVVTSTLPIEKLPREDLEKLGFIFWEQADDIFIKCTFPKGWKKVPTEHSMWSNLEDGNGNVRAMLFYKAAFYDRSAHFSHLNTRYVIRAEFLEDIGTAPNQDFNKFIRVRDNQTDEILFERDGRVDTYATTQTVYENECTKFLKKNFPKWEEVGAYWN